MALTSLNLVQQLSANLTSTGIKGNIPIGGTNDVTLTSDDADYMYEFILESAAIGNVVTWNVGTNQLTQTIGSAFVSQTVGVTIRDANGDAVQTSGSGDDKVVAIYYETEAANTGNIQIASGTATFGTLTLDSGEGTTSGVRVPRSALIVPRWENASGTITFTFSQAGDKIKVIFLGKT